MYVCVCLCVCMCVRVSVCVKLFHLAKSATEPLGVSLLIKEHSIC